MLAIGNIPTTQTFLNGEVLSPKTDLVEVIACPHPFKTIQVNYELPAGLSILEILEIVQPDPILRQDARIFIGDYYIARENWARVRPKPNTRLTIRIVPRGGGGSGDLLRIILMVAVVVIAIALPYALPAEIAATTVIGAAGAGITVGGLITAGTLLVGGLLINALVPPPKPKLNNLKQDTPTNFISGTRNQANIFGVVPNVLGKHKFTPPYAALPFTESVGADQYVRMIFTFGFGPVVVEDEKIGETPLSNFQGVETEFRRGYQDSQIRAMGSWDASTGVLPSSAQFGDRYVISIGGTIEDIDLKVGDTLTYHNVGLNGPPALASWDINADKPLTLYPLDTFEDALTIALTKEAGFQVRTSQLEADELSIDILFENGLVTVGRKGEKYPTTVNFTVDFSPVGQNAWVPAGEGIDPKEKNKAPGKITVSAAQTTAFITNMRWKTPSRGQYDVRIQRDTADSDSISVVDNCSWIALRSITSIDPITMHGVSKVAMRIKATDQFRGVVDEYNAVVTSIVLDYETSTQTWLYRPSSNPASLYRLVLQGAANKKALTDDRVDVAGLADWHDFCRTNKFEYNLVRDFVSSVLETLQDVASCGRASPNVKGSQWGVVIDREQTAYVQHFTPRNSWNFEGKRIYADLPHGLRIKFTNRDKNWTLDERIVFDDGYDFANATKYEEMELLGITDTDQIFKDGRFHFAQARLRPDEYTFNTDAEYIVATRGQMVSLTHDVMSIGIASARIKSLIVGGTNMIEQIIIDEKVDAELGVSYGISVRTVNDAKITAAVSVAGTTDTLILINPLPQSAGVEIGDLLAFGRLGQETLPVVIKTILPEVDLVARLTCVDASPAIHHSAEGPIPPYNSQITPTVGVKYPAIISIRSDERAILVNPDGSWVNAILVVFGYANRRPSDVIGLQVRYRLTDSASQYSVVDGAANAGYILLLGVVQGEKYDIQARFSTTSGFGDYGPVVVHTVIGPTEPPFDPINARVIGSALYWDYPNPPRDLKGFEIRFHRTGSSDWGTAAKAHQGVWPGSPFPLINIANESIILLVKAIDLAGNYSLEAATAVKGEDASITIDNIVELYSFAANNFPGAVIDGTLTGGVLQANGIGTLFWSVDAALFWSNDAALFYSEVYKEMVYEASFTPSASSVNVHGQMVLVADVDASSFTIDYTVIGNNPFWTVDGDLMWNLDPTSPMWTNVVSFLPWPAIIEEPLRAEYRFRFTTAPGLIQGIINDITVVLGFPDRVERRNDVHIDVGGTRLPLTQTFQAIKVVQVSIVEDGGAAAYPKVLDKDPINGPLVALYNVGTVPVAGTVDVTVAGY